MSKLLLCFSAKDKIINTDTLSLLLLRITCIGAKNYTLLSWSWNIYFLRLVEEMVRWCDANFKSWPRHCCGIYGDDSELFRIEEGCNFDFGDIWSILLFSETVKQ